VEIKSAGETFRVLKRCTVDEPNLREVSTRHWAACHQLPGYDQSPVTEPVLQHQREVVPKVVDAGLVQPGAVLPQEVIR
jgi:hypothetical protein